jgi:hypothetical protein
MMAKPRELALVKVLLRDKELRPYHISLFIGMLSLWQEQNYVSPFHVTRCKLMAASGIRSPATYHKCLKLLVYKKYIIYEPSFHPGKGSLVDFPEERPDENCFRRTSLP